MSHETALCFSFPAGTWQATITRAPQARQTGRRGARKRGSEARVPHQSTGEQEVIVHTRLESSHLAGNLLGDPSERDVFVYLPPGYAESDRRYPTAYLLHALGDSAASHITPAT